MPFQQPAIHNVVLIEARAKRVHGRDTGPFATLDLTFTDEDGVTDECRVFLPAGYEAYAEKIAAALTFANASERADEAAA